MNAWGKFNYDISYTDIDEMERKHVLSNKENLSDIIVEIFDKGGFNVKIDLTNDYNDVIINYKYWNGEVK